MNPDILNTICSYVSQHIPISYVHPLKLNTSLIPWSECLENKSLPIWILKSFKKRDDHMYWYFLGKNTGLPLKFIKDNINNRKFFLSLCQNPSVPMYLLEENFARDVLVDYTSLSKNTSLTTEFIEKYQDRLDWWWLSSNPCLSVELLEKYKDRLNMYRVIYNAPLEFIEKHCLTDQFTFWTELSQNPNLTEKFIRKYHDKLDWSELSGNPAVSLSFLIENKNKIDWKHISGRKDLTFDFVEKYKDKLDWYILVHQNNYIPIEFLNKNMGFYSWKYICSNVHITPDILVKCQREYEEDCDDEEEEPIQPSYFLCNERLCEKLFRENIKLYLQKYCSQVLLE